MDVLNKAATRIASLFRSLTLGARITVGLLLAVVAVSLTCLWNQQVSGPDSYLISGEPIAASQLPAMEAAFAKAGLSDYQVEGNRIKIPRGSSAAYMAALADAGALPPDFGHYLDETLKRIGPLTGRVQQEEMIKAARQNELSLIIRSMKGIERADVLYDVQKKSGLSGDIQVKASVNVKPSGNRPLDGEQVDSLRALLSGAIAGLDPHNVVVTDLNSGRTFYAGPDDAIGGTDVYAQRKRDYERLWTDKIRDSLEMIPGAIVTVNVELDPDLVNQQTRVEYDSSTDAGLRRGRKSSSAARSNPPDGRTESADAAAVGSVAKLASLLSAPGTPSAGVDAERAEPDSPGTSTSKVVRAPLRPLQATVAVGIPGSYFEHVWRRQHPATGAEPSAGPDAQAIAMLQAETISRVTTHVKNLLPKDHEHSDSRLNVTVTVFPDVAEKVSLLPEPPFSADAMQWLAQHGGSLGLGFLAVLCLLVLRSMVHTAASAEARGPVGGDGVDPARLARHLDESHDDEQRGAARSRRRPISVPAPHNELAEMVREDPGTAAKILRNWISSPS